MSNTEKKCSNCKSWSRIKPDYLYGTILYNSFGLCERNKSLDEIRNDNSFVSASDKEELIRNDEMYASVEEYYYPSIVTGENFYCKNFESK